MINKCDYREVVCPQECGEHVAWIKMDSHGTKECTHRVYECPECLQTDTYRNIVGDHVDNCIMVLEKCPAPGCDVELCSALVYFHMRTDCEFTPLECKYEHVGCTVKLQRSELDDHEQDVGTHLRLVLNKLAEYKLELEECKALLKGWNTHREGITQHPLKHRYSHSRCGEPHANRFPTVFKI